MCGPVVGPTIVKDFPEVKEVVRLFKLTNKLMQRPSGDERFYEEIIAADSNFFNLFTFPFLAGNPEGALNDVQSIVISRKAAIKYFNSTDVVGKTIQMPNDSIDLMITGVIADPPSNTQFRFDFIIPMETHRKIHHAYMQSWWSYAYYNYLLVKPGTDVKGLEDKIRYISRNYIPGEEDGSGYRQEYSLTALKDVHLHSALRSELEANNKISYIYIFSIIGIFILMIACINFMNLATARSAMRAKEIGLRKVAGAVRIQLISQFLAESFLMTLCAAILAIVIVNFLLNAINHFMGKDLSLFSNLTVWMTLAGIILLVGFLAGSYPSLFLSAMKASETIKGNFKSSHKGNFLRKGLVVLQFSISTFLIAGTIIIYNHIHFIQSTDLGFEKDRMLYIPTRTGEGSYSSFAPLKEEIKKLAGVREASLSSQVPGIEMDGTVVRLGWDESAKWSDMRFLTVDFDFMQNYNLEIIEGRAFDESYPSDATSAFIVNESGMRRLGWLNPKEAIGQKLKTLGRTGQIIGVMKDFHFMSANIAIEPFIALIGTKYAGYLSVKLNSGNPKETLNQIASRFNTLLPNHIFEYQFLDESFDKQYKSEDQFMKVFSLFALVAIIISCLGLYGLSLFMGEMRLKEIGVRKVLGATEAGLMVLFTRDFARLVLIAVLIALPLSYWAMNQWLSTFPLRQAISPLILLLSGLAALLIAMATVSFQSFRAARTNPVESIRNN